MQSTQAATWPWELNAIWGNLMRGKVNVMGMDEFKIKRALDNRRKDGGANWPADWAAVEAGDLVRLVELVASKGGAIRFGYTRDGGAYAVGVYYGDDYFTDYIRPSEDIDKYIDDLIAVFSEVDPSPAPKTSRRH